MIVSEEEYNAMLEMIYLSSQPGLVEDIKKGENEKLEDMPSYNPNEEW